jgi:outer membrane protein OmpA-like peptidoglycan-associated protein
MSTAYSKVVWTVGLMGLSTAALADAKPAPPQEPVGFIAGGVIGGFAAGPVGAVIGAGLGTWLGNRVHRAGEASKAEAQVAALKSDKSQLQSEAAALESAKNDLAETNRTLTARLDELSHRVEVAQTAKDGAAREEAAKVLDGLQGDVLFRTGSAEIPPEMEHEIRILAGAVAKSPALKVRVDGYADPRGTVDTNLKLSEARANAVRDLFLAAGVDDEALEVNAYGKSQSVAADNDGYALERRVRLTLQAAGDAPVAQMGAAAQPAAAAGPTAAAPADTAQTSQNE